MSRLPILLIAAVSAVASAQIAAAADIPVKAPVYKAAVAEPLYNLNGFYAGANGGWGFANADGTGFKLDPNSFGTHGTNSG